MIRVGDSAQVVVVAGWSYHRWVAASSPGLCSWKGLSAWCGWLPLPCVSTSPVLCLGLSNYPWRHCDQWHYSGLLHTSPLYTSPTLIIAWSRSAGGRSKRRNRFTLSSKVSIIQPLSIWFLEPWITYSLPMFNYIYKKYKLSFGHVLYYMYIKCLYLIIYIHITVFV